MVGSKETVKKEPRAQKAIEVEIKTLINGTLLPKMKKLPDYKIEVNELKNLRDKLENYIPEEKGTAVFFPKELASEFKKLDTLYQELLSARGLEKDTKVGAEIGSGKPVFAFGKRYVKLLEELPTTTAFKAETLSAPKESSLIISPEKLAARGKQAEKAQAQKEATTEKERLTVSLKKQAGLGGKFLLGRLPKFNKWIKERAAAETRLKTYETRFKKAKGKKRKDLAAHIKRERSKIAELDEKIKAEESTFRTYLKEYDRLYVLRGGLQDKYDPTTNSTLKKDYNLPVVAKKLRDAVKRVPAAEEAVAEAEVVPAKAPAQDLEIRDIIRKKIAALGEKKEKPEAELEEIIESDTPSQDKQERTMAYLGNFIAAPEPKTAAEKKKRFEILLEYYQDPSIRTQFYDDYERAQSLRQSLKKGELSAEDAAAARADLRNIESGVLPNYQKFVQQMNKYADTAADKRQVAKARRTFWKFRHKNLYRYTTAPQALEGRLEKLKVRPADLQKVSVYVTNFGDPRFERIGYDIYAGANAKRAQAIMNTLVTSGIVPASETRTSSYYENGKKKWRVELGTEYACAYSRALASNTDNATPYVPIDKIGDFQDKLHELFAFKVGDDGVAGNILYNETYLHIDSIGAQAKPSTIPFRSKGGAQEFYNLISEYGAMHGISILPQKGKDMTLNKAGWWTVRISAPQIEGVKRQTISDDPLAHVAMEAPVDSTPPPEAMAVELPEKKENLSGSAKAWLKKNYGLDMQKNNKKYEEELARYKALEPETSAEWKKALDVSNAVLATSTSTIAALEKAEPQFKKNPKLSAELAVFQATLAKVKAVHSTWEGRRDEAAKKAEELNKFDPMEVDMFPRAIDGRSSHLPYGQMQIAAKRYKSGVEWRYSFGDVRHAKRLEKWLRVHNFEGVKRRNKTVIIAANAKRASAAQKKEEAPAAAKAKEVLSAVVQATELSFEQQQMLEHILDSWSQPNADFLVQGNYAWDPRYIGTEKAAILEYMVSVIPPRQLYNVLTYLRNESYGLMNMEPASKTKLRVFIPKDAKTDVIIAGLNLLFMSKGLRIPEFRVDLRKDKPGKRQIRLTSKPALYMRPSEEFVLPPANKKGEVLIAHNGHTIALTKAQKDKLEAALNAGKPFDIIVYKRGKYGKQVDVRGAAIFVDYLGERGFLHIKRKAWKGKQGPARASVYAESLPYGYRDRPESLLVQKDRNLLEQPSVLRVESVMRKEAERDAIFADTLAKGGKFVMADNLDSSKRRIKGEEKLGPIIDSNIVPGELDFKAKRKLSTKEKKRLEVLRSLHRRDFPKNQKRELERVMNKLGYTTDIAYASNYAAENARRWLQRKFMGSGDSRTARVSRTRLYGDAIFTLHIESPAEDQFEKRHKKDISLPMAHNYLAPGAETRQGVNIFMSPRDRVIAESLLNKGGSYTFYMGEYTGRVTLSYLRSIGVPKELLSSEMVLVNDVPEEEGRYLLEADKQPFAMAITFAIPPVEEVPAQLQERSRREQYTELAERLSGALPYTPRNPSLNRLRRDILNLARDEKRPLKPKSFEFSKRLGGEEKAKEIFGILNDYPELAGVGVKGGVLVVMRGEIGARAEAEAGMRGMRPEVLKKRMEYLRAQEGASDKAAREAALYYQKKMEEKYPDEEVIVTVTQLDTPGVVVQNYYQEDPSKYSQETLSFNTFGVGGQYTNPGRAPEFRLLDTISRDTALFGDQPRKDPKTKEYRFPRSSAVESAKLLYRIHAGLRIESMSDTKKLRVQLYRKVGVTIDALNEVFPTFDSFDKALDDMGVGAGLRKATTQTALQIVERNEEYESWTPKEKRKYYDAVFEAVWRIKVAQIALECGFDPSIRLKTPDQYRRYIKNTLIPRLTATFILHEGTKDERTYRVLDRRVLTRKDEEFVTIPVEGDPDKVRIVGTIKGGKVEPIKDESDWKTVKIQPTWSIGPYGATPRDVPGSYTYLLKIEHNPITADVTIPGTTTLIMPTAATGAKSFRSSWERVWDDILLEMNISKEDLFKLADSSLKDGKKINPRINTLSAEQTMMGGKRVIFIDPPRERFKDNRTPEALPKYPMNIFKGHYSTAYVDDQNNVYAFELAGKKKGELPLNAREYYGKKTDKDGIVLGEEPKVKRVKIGVLDPIAGTIVTEEGGKYQNYTGEYEKHLFGHLLLSPNRMGGALTKEEVEGFETSAIGGMDYDKYHKYYHIKKANVGAYKKSVSSGKKFRSRLWISFGDYIPELVTTAEETKRTFKGKKKKNR